LENIYWKKYFVYIVEIPQFAPINQGSFGIPYVSEEPSPALWDELTEGNLLLIFQNTSPPFMYSSPRPLLLQAKEGGVKHFAPLC
jgi:hypothetical protein